MLNLLKRVINKCRRPEWILCKLRPVESYCADKGYQPFTVPTDAGNITYSTPTRIFTQKSPGWVAPGTRLMWLPEEFQRELPEFVFALVREDDVVYGWSSETADMSIETFGL